MSFTATAMFPGDVHEIAHRIAREAGEDLAKAHDAAAAVSIYARVWKQAAELGWCGVLVPEAHGGAGGSLQDVASLTEAASGHALALPIAGACAVAPILLSAGDAYRELSTLMPQVLAGSCRISPVLADANAEKRSLVIERQGGDYLLSGTVEAVETTGEPTHFLIVSDASADSVNEPALFILAADTAGLSMTRYQGMDGRYTADLAFEACRVPGSSLLARGETVAVATERARLAGAAIVCVETVAAIGALIEASIQYLQGRVQFGSPLAKLDVLRHKVAELYVGYETLKALVSSVVREAANPAPDWSRKVALAKLYAGEFGRYAAHAGIQLHGAMGMTEELLAARLARRILMMEFDYGSRTQQLTRLANEKRLPENPTSASWVIQSVDR